ncbi:MoaD/ThiS family protein [Synechococcus sp. ATX 2A4]|uniref:MoaD/ThiS family protein n=1 Tax=Synechococcus sp. ATX 2A4 TaxID=2823727 RepID=UPI0020CDBC33|nr:MoaD/ThiS family protein [Synechococcus sp. ATX 2A4]MCP9886229.1 MoaD/ThiS family protein [Synechococcus sp. ATX 2A4]
MTASVNTTVITVRLFAALKEQAGWAERRLELPAGAPAPTPAHLWRQLGLGETLPAQVRVAVNQVFASAHQPLAPGAEVAFLPPISGG